MVREGHSRWVLVLSAQIKMSWEQCKDLQCSERFIKNENQIGEYPRLQHILSTGLSLLMYTFLNEY